MNFDGPIRAAITTASYFYVFFAYTKDRNLHIVNLDLYACPGNCFSNASEITKEHGYAEKSTVSVRMSIIDKNDDESDLYVCSHEVGGGMDTEVFID